MREERPQVDLSKPTATGDLAHTPFTHLLVYCLDHELTGTLVLQSTRGRHALFVQGGVPAKASSCEPGAMLGQVLVDIGAVTEPMVRRALEINKRQKVPTGEALVREGVLDRATLRDGLRVQLRRRVVQLARLPGDTAFAFYQNFNLLNDWGGPETTPVEPLAAVLGAVRAQPDPSRWESVLGPLEGRALRLHPMTDPGRFSPSERDRAVIQALRTGRATLATLEASGAAPRDELYGLLYALTITRHLGAEGAPRAPVARHLAAEAPKEPVGAARSEPPSEQGVGTTLTAVARVKLRRVAAPAVEIRALRTPLPDELAEHVNEIAPPTPSQPLSSLETRRREVRERAASVASEDLFAVLGVGRDAGPEAIKSAFFAQAKRWHPDRIPSSLAEVRPLAARVFARLGEAYQTLTDPERRAAYEASLGASGATGGHESSSRSLRAAIEFQKAEDLLARGDFAGAERLALAAADDAGGRPEYRALGLWARAQRPGVGPERLAEIASEFDELAQAAPQNARALWFRARLLKRVGRTDEAIEGFRRVLAFEPDHAEAAREVQQFERKNTPAPAPPRPSFGRDLWGRLFKK